MKTYKDRLKKLANFLKKLPPSMFDIHTYVVSRPSKLEDLLALDRRCGGTLCPFGCLTLVFPHQFYCDDTTQFNAIRHDLFVVRPVNESLDLWTYLNGFLGLDDNNIARLFTAEGYNKKKVTPKDVATKITNFIKYDL